MHTQLLIITVVDTDSHVFICHMRNIQNMPELIMRSQDASKRCQMYKDISPTKQQIRERKDFGLKCQNKTNTKAK